MACATLKRTSHWDAAADANAKPPCKRRRYCAESSPLPTRSHQLRPSLFTQGAPKLTSDEIAANVNEETCRLHRRKRPGVQGPGGFASSTADSLTGGASTQEQPLFTMCQVGAICQRMLCEREALLRRKYDDVLNAKLEEQYETFVRFAHDQIRRRFEGVTPSYLS